MTSPTVVRTPITCGDCGAERVWRGKLASTMSCPDCGSANLGLTGVDFVKTADGATARHWQKGFQDARAGKPKKTSDGWDDSQKSDYEAGFKAGKEVPGKDNTGPAADPSKKNANLDRAMLEQLQRRAAYELHQQHPGLTAEALRRLSAPRGYGTGWDKPHPDPLKGWSEYAGPTPQTFPRQAPVADSTVCPVCKGSGYDLNDKARCRECGGTGVITHPTDRPATLDYDATPQAEPAGGAGWRGASFQGLTAEAQQRIAGRPSSDPLGSVEDYVKDDPNYRRPDAPPAKAPAPSDPAGPYVMNEASCPSCGHRPTELRKDKNEDAWWVCPNCGPLANIDRNPGVNPYQPPKGFEPSRKMKTSGFLPTRKTGRLMSALAKIHEANDLDEREAVQIARETVGRYREES